MFISNKYTKTYFTLINRAKSRPLPNKFEKHHIVPKSLGGSNKKENLVALTIKEHRLCHILLTKMVSDPKHKISMNCAAYRTVCCNKYPGLSKGSAYQFIREQFLEYNRTKTVSEKTKQKIKDKRALQTNISNQYLSGNQTESPRKGKSKDNDSGYKSASNKLKGREITWTEKLSVAGKSRIKCSCIKCKRVITVGYNGDKHFLTCLLGR